MQIISKLGIEIGVVPIEPVCKVDVVKNLDYAPFVKGKVLVTMVAGINYSKDREEN